MSTFQYKVGSTPKYVTGTLGWNPNGSLGSMLIADSFNTADAQNCGYSYDDLVRLQSVSCGPTNQDGTIWGQTFSYDAFGNITKSVPQSMTGITFAASYQLTNGTTNNQEQSVSNCVPTYNGNGNLTTDCTTSNTYTWDEYGHLLCINGCSTGISITYDALDRAVEVNTAGTKKEILYSPIGKVALMAGTNANNVFLPLPGGEQATYTSNTIRFRHYDWLGSARFESNMSEQEYGDVAYAPFGETYSIKNTPYVSFTGQQQDTVSGTYDFMYREYNSVQGRWISPDPAGLAAVDPTNPQTWNRYGYVGNSPLNMIDPSGLQAFVSACGIVWCTAYNSGSAAGGGSEFDWLSIPAYSYGNGPEGWNWYFIGDYCASFSCGGPDQAANNASDQLTKLLSQLKKCPQAAGMANSLTQMQNSGKLVLTNLGTADGSTSLTGTISIDSTYGITAHNVAHEYFHTIQMGTFMSAGQAGAGASGFPSAGPVVGAAVWVGARDYNAIASIFSGTPGFGPLDVQAEAFGQQISSQCGID